MKLLATIAAGLIATLAFLAPPSLASLAQQGTRAVLSPNGPGTVEVDGHVFALISSPQDVSDRLNETGTPAGGESGTFECSWKHDPDLTDQGNGPDQPITITVTLEKRSNEGNIEFARRCRAAVDAQRAVFPPNVGPSTP